MTKPLLHFSHGNSYPAGAYSHFFDYLRADYDIRCVDMHGHDPRYPVTDGWPELVAELIEQLESYQQPASRRSQPARACSHQRQAPAARSRTSVARAPRLYLLHCVLLR